MSFWSNVKTFGEKVLFKAKLHGPEIKTGLIVTGILGGTVLTWNAALKTKDILDERNKKLEDAETEEQRKDIRKHAVWQTVKACAAPGSVILGTIALTIENTHSMKQDISSATAAAVSATALLEKYRQRVRDDVGEKKDIEYRYGAKTVEVKTTDENGNEVTTEVQTINPKELKTYDYSFFLDAASWDAWTDNDAANIANIELIEEECNHFFKKRGFWWLNDTRKKFGLPYTDMGWRVGNVDVPEDPDRDCYIKFNVYTFQKEKDEGLLDPRELIYLITPNVEGPINETLKKLKYIGE